MSEREDYANAATMSMAGLRGLLDQMIAERDALTKQCDALRSALEEIGCIGTTALSCRKTTYFPVERWCVRCQALAGQPERERQRDNRERVTQRAWNEDDEPDPQSPEGE